MAGAIQENQPRLLGTFVTGDLKGRDASRQGVVINLRPDGTSVLAGESGAYYVCEGRLTRVPDRNIIFSSTQEFVLRIRSKLAEKKSKVQKASAGERAWGLKPGTGEIVFELMRQMDIEDSTEDYDPEM